MMNQDQTASILLKFLHHFLTFSSPSFISCYALFKFFFIAFKVSLEAREHLLPLTVLILFLQKSKEKGEEWGRDCPLWEIIFYFSHTKLYSSIHQTFIEHLQDPRYLQRTKETRTKISYLQVSHSPVKKHIFKLSQRTINSL